MLKKIDISKDIKERIIAPLPQQLIMSRKSGRENLSYISGATVIDMLNNIFGYSWSWEVKKQWIEESQPYFNKYSKSKEKVTHGGETGAWEAQGPVAHVHGTLTILMKDEHGGATVEIKKDGQGSKAIIGNQSSQDSIYKSAEKDAIKRAASLLGIGQELYRKEEEQIYFNEMNYEEPWTDEMQEKYKDEIEYVYSYIENAGLDESATAVLIESATGYAEYDVLPTNIEEVYNYLVKLATE